MLKHFAGRNQIDRDGVRFDVDCDKWVGNGNVQADADTGVVRETKRGDFHMRASDADSTGACVHRKH